MSTNREQNKASGVVTYETALNLENSLYNYKGLPHLRNMVPFFIELVDQQGSLQSIPFPNNEGDALEESICGLRLLINPATISVNMSKIISRTPTMTGFVEDHWGEELDTMTFQGKSAAFVNGGTSLKDIKNTSNRQSTDLNDRSKEQAAFYSAIGIPDYNIPTSADYAASSLPPGVVAGDLRRTSISYRQFKYLIDLFHTNGCFYNAGGFVSSRLYVQIFYDYSLYRGYFESIDLQEVAESPFTFSYTITFKSELTVYSFKTQSY